MLKCESKISAVLKFNQTSDELQAVEETARERQQICQKIARRLYDAVEMPLFALWLASVRSGSLKMGDAALEWDCRPRRVAHRVADCASDKNVWIAEDLTRETNECDGDGVVIADIFNGYGRKLTCGCRMCASCIADLRRRNRTRAKAIVDEIGRGDFFFRWRFVTLTGLQIAGASVLQTIAVYNYAFALLRKRDFWKCRVKGYVKGVEFEPKMIEGGRAYHTHLHLMVFSELMPVNEATAQKFAEYTAKRKLTEGWLAREWSECLRAAWLNLYGFELMHDANEGEFYTDIQLIQSKDATRCKPDEKALNDALFEVIKYTTKNTSWLKVDNEHLLEVASVERWPRMFEVGGSLVKTIRKREREQEAARKAAELGDAPAAPVVSEMSVVDDIGDACDVLPAVPRSKFVLLPTRGETWEQFCARIRHAPDVDGDLSRSVGFALISGREESHASALARVLSSLDVTGLSDGEPVRVYETGKGADGFAWRSPVGLRLVHDSEMTKILGSSVARIARGRGSPFKVGSPKQSGAQVIGFSYWCKWYDTWAALRREFRTVQLSIKNSIGRFSVFDGTAFEGYAAG